MLDGPVAYEVEDAGCHDELCQVSVRSNIPRVKGLTFRMIVICESGTSALGRPTPKRVETICNIEKIDAEMAARVMRAGFCQQTSTSQAREDSAAHHHAS